MIKKNLTIRDCSLTLYNADYKDVLKSLANESIDLCVSDPPYNISHKNLHNKEEADWDKFTSDEFIIFLSEWLNEVYRVLTPKGTCWFFYAFTRIREVLAAVDSTKFINKLINHFVYARSKGRGAKHYLKSLREECAMLVKSKDYEWNSLEYLRRVIAAYHGKGGVKRGWDVHPTTKTNARFTGLGNVIPIFTALEETIAEDRRGVVLDIGSGERLPLSGDIYDLQFPTVPSVLNKMEKQVHSAQKSILIQCMLIMLSSKQGDTVLDCFGGSFSCGAAAVICGRNYIGIEREPETFKKGLEFVKNVPYDRWETYVKTHVSSSEKGFRFGEDSRAIMRKT